MTKTTGHCEVVYELKEYEMKNIGPSESFSLQPSAFSL